MGVGLGHCVCGFLKIISLTRVNCVSGVRARAQEFKSEKESAQNDARSGEPVGARFHHERLATIFVRCCAS
jgi:hypothetical protein